MKAEVKKRKDSLNVESFHLASILKNGSKITRGPLIYPFMSRKTGLKTLIYPLHVEKDWPEKGEKKSSLHSRHAEFQDECKDAEHEGGCGDQQGSQLEIPINRTLQRFKPLVHLSLQRFKPLVLYLKPLVHLPLQRLEALVH